MRGKEKAESEWCLVCLSYNLKKLFTLQGGLCPEKARKREGGVRIEQIEHIFSKIRQISDRIFSGDFCCRKIVKESLFFWCVNSDGLLATSIQQLATNQYSSIVLAVGHDEFKAMAVEELRSLRFENSVVYDIKSVLPLESVDGRL